MLNRRIVEPTAASAATRETTAETNASPSILSRRLRLVADVTCSIERCLSCVLNQPDVPVFPVGRADAARRWRASSAKSSGSRGSGCSANNSADPAVLVCGDYRSDATGRPRPCCRVATGSVRGGLLGAWRDRARCDTDPGALTLLV